MRCVKVSILGIFLLFALRPTPAYADFFGGDLPLLTQIVVNTLQELAQLRAILGTGQDSLNLMRDINRGINDAMNLARTMNVKLTPGILSELQSANEAMAVIEKLYGKIPMTNQAKVQQTMDQTVAEALQLHNDAFRYADEIDPQAEQIKDYAKVASPAGAEKLTAQSLGVLIHVMNQVLRTNAALLKVQSEQLAMQSRKSKLSSEQFKVEYDGLSKAFGELKADYPLPSLSK
jgi:hypothetical protein